jgi:hypothetical protein
MPRSQLIKTQEREERREIGKLLSDIYLISDKIAVTFR